MTAIVIIFSVIIFILVILLWNYQRQVKYICRQLAFLREHESNMMISGEMQAGGLEELMDEINEVLKENRRQRKLYIEKEKNIADIYTNLSHDIRTPLTSLDGYFQLLRDCDNEEDKKRYISVIEERIDSLNDMLEELFTFTKLKNDAYQLELSGCNVNKILKEIVLSYYEDWIAQGITPALDITEKPLYVEANEKALRRVMQNIVKNVLVYGQNMINISLMEIEEKAVLRISNQVSNPEEINITKVFERFYKADGARGKTSTGLGLSIAYGFVKKMNGDIRAELDGRIFSIVVEMFLLNHEGSPWATGKVRNFDC